MKDLVSWAKAKPTAIDKLLVAMATRKPKAAKTVRPEFDDLAIKIKPRESLGDQVLRNWGKE